LPGDQRIFLRRRHLRLQRRQGSEKGKKQAIKKNGAARHQWALFSWNFGAKL
jgi:hypothetical protein